MNEIYLDNSATTRPSEAVLRIMEKTLREDFGNPSSMHRKGVEAEQYVRDARKILSRILKVSEGEIYFTSGGTEGNNWAIIGGAMAQRRAGNRIITTEMEHPAVAEPFAFLEKQGFEVVKIPVDKNGVLDLAAFREALTENTVLVSAMYVNNEIGAVVPVEELSALIVDQLAAQKLTSLGSKELERQAYAVNNCIKDPELRNMNILAAV